MDVLYANYVMLLLKQLLVLKDPLNKFNVSYRRTISFLPAVFVPVMQPLGSTANSVLRISNNTKSLRFI